MVALTRGGLRRSDCISVRKSTPLAVTGAHGQLVSKSNATQSGALGSSIQCPISWTVVGESPDCLLLSGTVVGENLDYVCWDALEV